MNLAQKIFWIVIIYIITNIITMIINPIIGLSMMCITAFIVMGVLFIITLVLLYKDLGDNEYGGY